MADTKISAATLTTPQATDLIPLARSGSSVARHATVAAIVQAQAASTTAVGSVELATAAETQTGTSSTLAVTPAGLAAASYPVYNATSYGAVGGSDSTAAIQAAMDAAGAAGGGIVVVEPSASAYLLTVAGANPYDASNKYCLIFNYSNVWLDIQPGAELKLSNAQQTDAGGGVDLIIWRDKSNIRIYGGGSICGNTAGQTGWTGGYAQTANGCLIKSFGSNGGGNDRITVENLKLYDCFSNATDLSAYGEYDNTNITVRGLRVYSCGEGVVVSYCNGFLVTDILVDDSADVSVGDGIEVSSCCNGSIVGVTVQNHGGGSAIDLASSQNVVLSDFTIDKWIWGVTAQCGAVPGYQKDIVISNGTIRDLEENGMGIEISKSTYRITIANVNIYNVPQYGIELSPTNELIPGPITITGCTIDTAAQGIAILTGVANLSITNCQITNATTDGIYYLYGAGGGDETDRVGLNIANNQIRTCGRYGIYLSANSGVPSGWEATGSIVNCRIENCTTDILRLDEGAYLDVEGIYPNSQTGDPHTDAVAGAKYYTPSGANVWTLYLPTKSQQIILVFSGLTTVYDKSNVAVGDNLNLLNGADQNFNAGSYLCMQYDNTTAEWFELWRRA